MWVKAKKGNKFGCSHTFVYGNQTDTDKLLLSDIIILVCVLHRLEISKKECGITSIKNIIEVKRNEKVK